MKTETVIYTKTSLIERLIEISQQGWILCGRPGNVGGIGNTLEDLLGIKENNLPIPNAAEWELKTQRLNTTSLTTLFHLEPSPRAINFVPQILLPNYGWLHKESGKKYKNGEMSFRQTINSVNRSDRGFKITVNKKEKKIEVSFEAAAVDSRNQSWLRQVEKKIGLRELDPQPYWGFADLEHKAGTKLPNTFYVQAEVKREKDLLYYRYTKIKMLRGFSFEGFLKALERSQILVDFDSRTGHNHGTKFRLRQNAFPLLFSEVEDIL